MFTTQKVEDLPNFIAKKLMITVKIIWHTVCTTLKHETQRNKGEYIMYTYQAKETMFNYLQDTYAMSEQQCHEILGLFSPQVFNCIAAGRLLVSEVVAPMVAYGNMKVMNCVQIQLESVG